MHNFKVGFILELFAHNVNIFKKKYSTSCSCFYHLQSYQVSQKSRSHFKASYLHKYSAADDAKTYTFNYIDDLSLREVRPANQLSQIEKDA